MKQKKVLLVYHTNGIDNLASVHKAFKTIIDEMISEGRIIKEQNGFSTKFEDGTTVEKIALEKLALSVEAKGMRVTHLYIDVEIFKLGNGEKYINDALIPMVIPNDDHPVFDIKGSWDERVFFMDSTSGFTNYIKRL